VRTDWICLVRNAHETVKELFAKCDGVSNPVAYVFGEATASDRAPIVTDGITRV